MPGPNSFDATLVETKVASPLSPLADNKCQNITFFAEPSYDFCVSLAKDSPYTPNQMDVFTAYEKHLYLLDLDVKTKMRYMEVVHTFRKWLVNRRPDATTAQEFLAYLRSKGYRPRSVLLYYHALRLFLGYRGIQFKVKLRKPRELPPYHGKEEIEKLIAQADIGLYHQTKWHRERNKAMILTFCYTGIRKQELLNLKVSDINFERRLLFIRQGKGSKDRMIPLSENLIAPLKIQCGGKCGRDIVFKGLNARSVYRIITTLAKTCGIENLHPHSLRHYFASQLVELGINLRAIQELLGHADLSTTAIYLDINPQHLKSAIDTLDKATTIF